MKKQDIANSQDRGEQVSIQKANVIKLGLDVHADSIMVVRQIDGQTPQPAQRFKEAAFLAWAVKQLEQACEVWSCYEAGPLGFGLHRKLCELSVKNIIICPKKLDDEGTGVKTDRKDALKLVLALDRYIAGNKKTFSVVWVPTRSQEQARCWGRMRQQFRSLRQSLEASGRSLLLTQGFRAKGPWWNKKRWSELKETLPDFLVQLLEQMLPIIRRLDQKVTSLTQKLEAESPEDRPKGAGALSTSLIQREIGDWNRFKNRRNIGSYTGLCPGESSSGSRRRQGRINKHGNPRLRHLLVEMAWRVIKFQPGYHAVKKMRKVLCNGSSVAKKKAVVAIARQLAIDLWRIQTKRVECSKLGLVMAQ